MRRDGRQSVSPPGAKRRRVVWHLRPACRSRDKARHGDNDRATDRYSPPKQNHGSPQRRGRLSGVERNSWREHRSACVSLALWRGGVFFLSERALPDSNALSVEPATRSQRKWLDKRICLAPVRANAVMGSKPTRPGYIALKLLMNWKPQPSLSDRCCRVSC